MLKIAITGGPGAGKTEISSKLIQLLEGRGYKVFWIPETATELILNGIAPSNNISNIDFQKFVLEKQLSKEALYDKAVKYYDKDKTIIFCDRGIMDSCAYVEKEVFGKMLGDCGLSFSDAYNRYDAVLHLVTAADGAEEFYQWNDPSKEGVGNNAARLESPEEARNKDKLTLNAWISHPHLRVFDNSTDFAGKVSRVVEEVFSLLGEPVPKEIERKYLIEMPTEDELKALGCVSHTNIIQTYLVSHAEGVERRVRQRGTAEDGYTFFYTEKSEVGNGERLEKEEKISLSEYVNYLSDADTSLHQISKERLCFVYDNRYFELDIYPFSDKYAILEIEVNSMDEQINLPALKVVKEVTDDMNYRNHSLAKTYTL